MAFGRGEAWVEVKAWMVELPVQGEKRLPAVSEPFLAWTVSGEAEFQEREGDAPWITYRLRKGSFFLTSGGAPYDCRWRAVTAEPFVALSVFIELPLLQRALEEVYGAEADRVRLRDLSAFTDGVLDSYMEGLRGELMQKQASALGVQGLGQLIAVHLARNYAGWRRKRGAGGRRCRASS
ncbi:MAG: hypothetical protein QM796_13550 [Chthoniobacteraceae bacterium]